MFWTDVCVWVMYCINSGLMSNTNKILGVHVDFQDDVFKLAGCAWWLCMCTKFYRFHHFYTPVHIFTGYNVRMHVCMDYKYMALAPQLLNRRKKK